MIDKLRELHATLITEEEGTTTAFKPPPPSAPTPATSGPDLFRVAYRALARARQRGIRLKPIPAIDADGKPLDEDLVWPAIMRATPPGHYLVLGEAEAYLYAVASLQKYPDRVYQDLLPGYNLKEIKRIECLLEDGSIDPDPKIANRFYGMHYERRLPTRVELSEADQARLDHVMRTQ